MKGIPVISFKKFISESINDKGIFKALFVIGIPGAGKSYTTSKLMGVVAPRIVNTDKAAEFVGRKIGLKINSDSWKYIQNKTHSMTKNSLANYINGMLPLFIDGTSNNTAMILHRMGILESLGYDVGIVFVHCSLETAKKRAKERESQIGREVDESFIDAVYKNNKENARFLKGRVSFYKEVENDTDKLDDQEIQEAFERVQSFYSQPVKNPLGKNAIDEIIEGKGKYLVPLVVSKEELDRKIDGWYS